MTTSLVPVATTGLAQRTPVTRELGLAGRLLDNRYVLPPDTPVDDWLSDGEVLQAMEKRVGFWLGDWLRAGEARYGDQYTQALKATGHAYQTLKNAKRVAVKFPAEARVHEGLAFAHYDAVAALPPEDAHELLAEAADDKLSSRDLRDRARFRQGQLDELKHAALPVPRLVRPDMQLLVGDALALPLPDALVDLIVTSPPYALEKGYDTGGDEEAATWVEFIFAFCAEAYRVAKEGARFALNVPVDTTVGGNRPTYAQAVSAGLAARWKYRSTIVWCDGELGKPTARGSYDAERRTGTAQAPSIIAPSEAIILFSKGPWKQEEPVDRPSDIEKDDWLDWTNGHWTFWGERNAWEGHPAPFPEEMPRRLVHLLSFPGDLVLDPFMGSGTTGVVALRTGRRFIGVDRSPLYVAGATRRINGLDRAR